MKLYNGKRIALLLGGLLILLIAVAICLTVAYTKGMAGNCIC